MCGIAGFIDLTASSPGEDLAGAATAMADAIRHRGPDSGGVWHDAAAGAALAFRRLAIIDLAETGNQPMTSANGRFVITFNGEIYNFRDLAAEIADVAWRGHSDTEIMLEHFARSGFVATLKRLNGMFAIALFDRETRELWLARDRLGIKPLYHGRDGNRFYWGSELKAIVAHPGFAGKVDREAIAAYLAFNHVPAPRTIYRGIAKLKPGHWLRLAPDGTVSEGRYWDLGEVAARPKARLDEAEAVRALTDLLGDAVARQLVADVPVGVLLSGGLDSSSVAALAARTSSRPVRTFTIGFAEAGYDEASHAAAVARHLGTDHTELKLSADDARALIPALADWYDEPFADSSALPTYLVSRLARESVTVALSGDGGDEGFFGYNRHRVLADLARRIDPLPGMVRQGLAAGLRFAGPGTFDALFRLVPEGRRPRMAGDKAMKLARALAAEGDARYLDVVGHWRPEDGIVPGLAGSWTPPAGAPAGDVSARTAYFDTLGYLPDDILTKVDRASMAVSLEARVPLLDHRVIEFAWSLPTGMKIRDGKGKWLLRQMLHAHVPRELVERPKAGFAVPLDAWLKGPLRDWAETLLAPARLSARGFVDPAAVGRVWQAFLAGRNARSEAIWSVLMLEAWAERWLGRP